MNFTFFRLIIVALSVIELLSVSEGMQNGSKRSKQIESSGNINPGGKRKEPHHPNNVHLPSMSQSIEDARDALNYVGILYATMYPSYKQVRYYKDEIALRKTLEAGHAEIIQTLDGTALLVMHKDDITIVYGGLFMGKEGTPQEIRLVEGHKVKNKFYGIPPTFLVQAGYGTAVTGIVRCHRGAYERFSLSWDEIYSHIARYAEVNNKPLTEFHYTLIGHSLGGVVAQLAALRLATITFQGKPENHIRLITFGPARLFDGGLVAFYHGLGLKEYSLAVLNQNDRVFESAPLSLGYATPGRLLTIPPYEKENPLTNKKEDPHTYPAYKDSLTKATPKNTTLGNPASSPLGESLSKVKKSSLAPLRAIYSGVQIATGKGLVEQEKIEVLMKNSLEAKNEEKILKLIRSGAYSSEEQALAQIAEGNREKSELVKKVWAQLHQEVTE